MTWPMVLILFLLFFVMMFGIGFILNMLVKTTWMPVFLYVFLILPYVIFAYSDNFMTSVKNFHVLDYATAIAGILGAFMSGKTISLLRSQGYKMF